MKALVFKGKSQIKYQEKEKPVLCEPTDAIVKIVHTTICGTDLHIIKGDVPEVPLGLTLGHEGVGVIEEVGSTVQRFKVGDRVIVSCITSCSSCEYCRTGLPSHCEKGGWILGHLIDGTQAEYVRIPYADTSLYLVPAGVDEKALTMLSDILPTGFEIGVLSSQISPGDTVAIVGAGPIGLSALLTAQFYSPAEIILIDLNEERLKVAQTLGATHCISSADGNAVQKVLDYTKKGVDVAIEAVGIPATFDICQEIVTAGGTIANIGVHGKSVDFHIEKLWAHNIKLTTGLVNATSTPTLLKTVISKKLEPSQLITHHFPLSEIEEAYRVFGNACEHKALKVIISP